MKIKILLIMSFTTLLFAAKNSFTDRPLKISLNGKYISVSFLQRSAVYRLDKKSECLKVLKAAIENESDVDVVFSPKDLIISSCRAI